MQRINIDVFCWSFSILFFSVSLASLGLGVYAVWHLSQPESVYYLVGSIVYLVGSFLVTVAGNVPLNNALARVDPDAHNAIATSGTRFLSLGHVGITCAPRLLWVRASYLLERATPIKSDFTNWNHG